MKKHMWGFFPFDAMDYKAAQAYLDKKADEGWVLDRVYWRHFARFVPAEGRYHFVDLELRSAFDDGPDEDYLQLCEDAGWELIPRTQGILLFRSRRGTHPAPIQGDDEIEADRFWKRLVRKNLLVWIAALLLLAGFYALIFSSSSGSPAISALLLSNAGLLILALLILGAAFLIWQACSVLARYARWRRSGVLSSTQYRSAFVRGVLGTIILILCVVSYSLNFAEKLGLGKTVDVISNAFAEEDTATRQVCEAYPVLLGSDLGLDWENSYSRSLIGTRSILVDRQKYTELTKDGSGNLCSLVTEHYDCTGAAVARWLLDARRKETTDLGDLFYGSIQWTQIDGTGFDECWADIDNSHLLLRERDTVILVGAMGFDLTEPEHLKAIRQRMLD